VNLQKNHLISADLGKKCIFSKGGLYPGDNEMQVFSRNVYVDIGRAPDKHTYMKHFDTISLFLHLTPSSDHSLESSWKDDYNKWSLDRVWLRFE